MKLATVRNMMALLFALVIAGGSVASAGGARDFGECRIGTEQLVLNGGARDFGE